jgi:hypothetical protein
MRGSMHILVMAVTALTDLARSVETTATGFPGSSDLTVVVMRRVGPSWVGRRRAGRGCGSCGAARPERDAFDALDQVVDCLGRTVEDVGAVPGDDLVAANADPYGAVIPPSDPRRRFPATTAPIETGVGNPCLADVRERP